MGLGIFKSSSCACPTPATEPTPAPEPSMFRKAKVLRHKSFKDDVHVVEVEYANCTNFEGKKILVFRGAPLKMIKTMAAMGALDPHFCDTGHLSPVARFRPTEEGWRFALWFAEVMLER